MSLQWTLIAGFLYAEIVVVLLLVLPIASPKRWAALFRSRFLQGLKQQSGFYFMILIAILILFLMDAVREMRKYSTLEAENDHKHLDAEMQGNMRLFRAQRNFYISGFALFLSLVIRRLVSLILSQAALLAQSEAALKQAVNASSTARTLLAEKGSAEDAQNVNNSEITDLKKQITELEQELKLEVKDKQALKSQADNLAKEYDRLLEEHSKLQKQLVAGGDKKED